MEQVLDIYEQPYNPLKPVICFDERPCQLLENVFQPIAMKPGRIEREDYHYKRNGTCAVLMAVEPLAGHRTVKVTKQRTKKDYAQFMKALAESYPEAEKIILVQDNLNTHNPSSFYETFEAPEAFALSERFEMVYTPKKASWLNMAEIELSALSKQCLDRRIADIAILSKEVYALTKERNRGLLRNAQLCVILTLSRAKGKNLDADEILRSAAGLPQSLPLTRRGRDDKSGISQQSQ